MWLRSVIPRIFRQQLLAAVFPPEYAFLTFVCRGFKFALEVRSEQQSKYTLDLRRRQRSHFGIPILPYKLFPRFLHGVKPRSSRLTS